MKYANYLQLSIIIVIFSFTMETYLDLTTHFLYVQKRNNNWYDLLNVEVACPNRGVFKNFIIQRNSTHYWFKYQCYSAVKEESDYGESVIKQVTLTTDFQWTNYNINNYITSLNGFEISCWPDYSLKSFVLFYYNGLKRNALCHGAKASYTTTVTIETEKKSASRTTMDGLFDIMVGRTDQETDVNVGFPLRGFKFVIDSSKSRDNPTVYFNYSYSVLRNMKVVRDSYKARFEQLRNSNTQKN